MYWICNILFWSSLTTYFVCFHLALMNRRITYSEFMYAHLFTKNAA